MGQIPNSNNNNIITSSFKLGNTQGSTNLQGVHHSLSEEHSNIKKLISNVQNSYKAGGITSLNG